MNAASETKMAASKGADQQTFIVLGVLLQFLSSPEQINNQISMMRGTVPPRSRYSTPQPRRSRDILCPEWFAGGLPVRRWQTVTSGEVVFIPGNVRHALRNTSPSPTTTITVSKLELYNFFRELARPSDPNSPPATPSPEEMQQLFSVAKKYEYWLASHDENAAIDISLR